MYFSLKTKTNFMDSLQQYHAYKLVISVMYLKWTKKNCEIWT